MGPNLPPRRQPTVFISYAHESDVLRAAVKALADWLGNRGCSMLTDHDYVYRPPPPGWQTWMHECAQEADTVLVVCTQKLKARYEKNAPVDTGHGATFEGAIVTQHLYDNAMRNTKVFPILPDGGRVDDIPTTLKSWWNSHRFPSGNEGILRMIFDEPAAAGLPRVFPDDSPQSEMSSWAINKAHEEKTTEALRGHPVFFRILRQEFSKYFKSAQVPETEAGLVQFFARCAAGQVQILFYLVRRALLVIDKDSNDVAAGHRTEEAAAYLYCLAACRLVDQAEHQARISARGIDRYIVSVPTDENVVCAIIATALFGGELRLVSSEDEGLPRAEYVFEVNAPEGSDHIETDFELEAYVAVHANDGAGPDMSLDRGSGRALTAEQRDRLKTRIGEFMNVEFSSVAFLVRGLETAEVPGFATASQSFARNYEVPVMVPETEATSKLLGMEVGTLRAEIREFWRRLKVWPRSAAPSQKRPSPAAAGGPAMLPSGQGVHFHGPVYGSVSTGDHSAVQTGTGHSAHIDHRQGADLEALTPLLQELVQAIDTLSSSEKRDDLIAHIELAQLEAGKKDNADPGRIKRALDAVKRGAEGLEHGGKIITLCNKAYNVTAPLLGLPSSPLP